MLGSRDIVAFLATRDAGRARAFYEGVLGLRLVADEPFALARHTALGWLVPDTAATVGRLAAGGVTFERYPGLPHDDLGVCTFPGGSRVAWFKDPDGNTLSLTQAESAP